MNNPLSDPTVSPAHSSPPSVRSGLADDAVAQVIDWLAQGEAIQSRQEVKTAKQLEGVVADPEGVEFTMAFVDRVVRSDDQRIGARQLASLVNGNRLPQFLSPVDRVLLRVGARLAPVLPWLVMPLAQRRLRGIVGHLVVNAEPTRLRRHLAERRASGFGMNVNLLGEAVLGQTEADRRLAEARRLLQEPDIDYVSVKLSSLVPHLNYWDYSTCLEKVSERLRLLFHDANQVVPPTFINLDMEEYHDLELTLTAFMSVLDEPELVHVQAGIVLQAYLPDSFAALQTLSDWAQQRQRRVVDGRSGGEIKVRLVKGANLAMERVEAAMHGWELAPYGSKAEADANYKRCLDWILTPERTQALRVGLASHNLFDVAFALLLATERGVGDRLEVEMLEGMAATHARLLGREDRHPLLYTPVVKASDFDVAISYLFRRLEENASSDNFIRHLFGLRPGTDEFRSEEAKFRSAVAARWDAPVGPRRHARLQGTTVAVGTPFTNEPDSDPAIPEVRAWAAEVMAAPAPSAPEMVTESAEVDRRVARAVTGGTAWAGLAPEARREILYRVADRMADRRGELITAMVHEGRKTFAQADPEVSEAIDFARWYADRAGELDGYGDAAFAPFGVVVVAPPWNFPVAIPAGGVLAALAAGNAVLLKPAPEVPACAALVAECCWEAGVPDDAVQLLRVPDNEVGRRLITHPDVGAVILTGAYETAELFRSWRPDLALFAETSGKNALIITPSADVDLAVSDLVASAFGHSGQKCSAASLAICVGSLYESERFRRQLTDAVRGLTVGEPTNLSTDTGPLVAAPNEKLRRGLTELDPGESWLIEPRQISETVWSPGVRLDVRPESWFHHTECFGPVLGLIHVETLDDAIAVQNATAFGLTGGIHSLDPAEVAQWMDAVEVGNAYVNRVITGAIVCRQPFGGWKRSSIGPGAKAGGPNYVSMLGVWTRRTPLSAEWLEAARRSDEEAWTSEFGVEHDPTGLFCEANIFRYRPIRSVAVRVEADADPWELSRVLAAAERCGVPATVSTADDETSEAFAQRLEGLAVERVRIIGPLAAEIRDEAHRLGLHVADEEVTGEGRREMLHYLREQAISRTMHRYGNLID